MMSCLSSGKHLKARQLSWKHLLAAEARREFDLEHGPLVHATLYELSPSRHVLSINIPALCADSRTLQNLFTELSESYSATTDAEEPFQYLQFAEWQNSLCRRTRGKGRKRILEQTGSNWCAVYKSPQTKT